MLKKESHFINGSFFIEKKSGKALIFKAIAGTIVFVCFGVSLPSDAFVVEL